MSIFCFMMKKVIKPTALMTVGLVCFACIFLYSSFGNTYGNSELYAQLFETLPKGKEGYEQAKHNSERLNDESAEIMKGANKYISEHTNGSIPPILPKEMVEQVFEARFGDGENAGTSQMQSVYSLAAAELYSQTYSYELIAKRNEGYSRNLRRGVTDEYSLKTAEKMTVDYEKVLEYEDKASGRYDTRWADRFVDFISTEFISSIGIFMLLFPVFSSELQSGRFKAFKLTGTGAMKYSAYRMICGILQTILFFTIYYFVLASFAVLMSGSGVMSMPVQYLNGFELSHLPMSFGGFLIYVYLMKLVFAVMLSALVMLLSLISGRVIISALIGILPFAVPAASKHMPVSETVRQIISCDVTAMNNDINIVNIGGKPVGIVSIYFIGVIAATICCILATLFLSKRRDSIA